MAFKYVVIDNSRLKNLEEIELTNFCFSIWKKYFEADLSSRGEKLNLNEFHRARFINIILYNNEVAGFHLYSVFDLRELQAINHGYIAQLDNLKDQLFSEGLITLLSMEYLTVDEKFRKTSDTPTSIRAGAISEMVIRLGIKFARSLGLDATIGIARKDRKVNVVAEKIGFTDRTTLVKYENPCSVVIYDCKQVEKNDDDIIRKSVDKMWDERQQNGYSKEKTAA